MIIEKTDFGGWPNCYRISNGEIELVVTSDVGPRIMRYGFPGGRNFFKEFPAQLAGLLASFAGMVAGSLAPQWVSNTRTPHRPLAVDPV